MASASHSVYFALAANFTMVELYCYMFVLLVYLLFVDYSA